MAEEKKNQKINSKIPVYMEDGSHEEAIELPKTVFHDKVNKRLLAQYVRMYLHNMREYNASTKTRGEVTGSTRKIYRQKGTGKARHGSIKAPIFVGGGVVFGPQPRNVTLLMNKKQKQKALSSALSQKVLDGTVMCISDSVLSIKPKTKLVSTLFSKMGVETKKNLVVIHKDEKNTLSLGARNIPNVNMVDVNSINPYIILKSDIITFTQEAIAILKKRFVS